MATIYFTNNANTGDGSLRNAWINASAGDVIMPDPTVFAAGSTITIVLGSNWSFRTVDATIDGGDCRIVLDAQNTYRVGTGTSSDIVNAFRNVDFKDFYGGGSGTAGVYPAYFSGLGSLTFTNCRFYGNNGGSGATSAFIRSTNLPNSTITLNNCVVYNNGASGSARIIYSAGGSVVLNGCTCYAASPYGNYTSNDSLLSAAVDFATAGFVDASAFDYRLTASSPYLTGGTLTGSDFLGHTRSGSIGAFDGSWYVAKGNDSKTLEADAVVDYVELESNSTVYFSGSDRILTAKKAATVGAASLTASSGSNGYFAAPSLGVSSATLSGVVACYYGAGLTAFEASFVSDETVGFSITKTNDAPVLVERATGSSWTTISTDADASTRVQNVTTTTTFRAFDGVEFIPSQVQVVVASPFWRILDWAVANTTGGDGSSAWNVTAWAVDPELEED